MIFKPIYSLINYKGNQPYKNCFNWNKYCLGHLKKTKYFKVSEYKIEQIKQICLWEEVEKD